MKSSNWRYSPPPEISGSVNFWEFTMTLTHISRGPHERISSKFDTAAWFADVMSCYKFSVWLRWGINYLSHWQVQSESLTVSTMLMLSHRMYIQQQRRNTSKEQEGLAVASIARDDPSTQSINQSKFIFWAIEILQCIQCMLALKKLPEKHTLNKLAA